MQQLSRPYQIALGALVVFAIAWFTVLKPSDDDSEPAPLPAPATATAPGQAGLDSAVGKAKGAVTTSSTAAAATQGAANAAGGSTTPTASAPTASAPTTPAPAATTPAATTPAATATSGAAAPDAPTDPSTPLLNAVAKGKVAVILFSGPDSSDDRAVRLALARADKHDGRVVTRSASISRVGDYAAISQGVQITQAPSLVVIGKGDQAKVIVGYTDTRSIDQLVSDVGGAAFIPRRFKGYRGRIENVCSTSDVYAFFGSVANGGDDLAERLRIGRNEFRSTLAAVVALHPTGRYVAFHKALLADFREGIAVLDRAQAAEKRQAGGALPSIVRSLPPLLARDRAVRAAARKTDISGCTS